MILSVVAFVSCYATNTAEAHWIKTPYQINKLHGTSAKIDAYRTNLNHAQGVIRFLKKKNNAQHFTFESWGHTIRAHKFIIKYSANKIDSLQWAMLPPHYKDWLCIHNGEGSWTDSGDPFWGGLQMDTGFMRTYAPRWLLKKGWANSWTPLQQMWVAERAYNSGRGFYPWPNTARNCGLI